MKTCEHCNKKVKVLYANKKLKKWVCEKCDKQ